MVTRWIHSLRGIRVSLGVVLVGTCVSPAAIAGQVGEDVTFSKDVAQILQRSCQGCHRPGPG